MLQSSDTKFMCCTRAIQNLCAATEGYKICMLQSSNTNFLLQLSDTKTVLQSSNTKFACCTQATQNLCVATEQLKISVAIEQSRIGVLQSSDTKFVCCDCAIQNLRAVIK